MKTCWICWVAVGLHLLAVIGCGQSEPSTEPTTDLTPYSSLTKLNSTHNLELQDELARIRAEKATPLQLMEKPAKSKSDSPRLESTSNVPLSVARLDVIFPRSFRDSTRDRIAKAWPKEGFEFTPASLHVIAAWTERFEIKREQYVKVISRLDFHLPVDHSLGLLADTDYLDAIEIGHRLVGMHTAELLSAGRLDAAVDSVGLMLRVSEELANQKSIISRGSGAVRRAEALQVLSAIAQHPEASPSHQRQLGTWLDEQLESWPDETGAWIGDRAQGMLTYELIRDGHFLSLFSYEEIREYRNEVGIEKLAKVVSDNIDQDELFYLQTMRDVIDACEDPHYKRSGLYQRIGRNLELLRDGEDYAFVADQLLLLQLEDASRMLALDRARCEAWALAFRIAFGQPPEEKNINPLTGEPFFVEVSEDKVIVDAIDPSRGELAAVVFLLPIVDVPEEKSLTSQ